MELALLALALSACAPFSVAHTCITTAGATVNLNGDSMSCERAQVVEDAARVALTGHGFTSDAQFRALSSQTTVWIHSEVALPDQFDCGGEVVGCNYAVGSQTWIELTSGGESWAHEMLHSVDLADGASLDATEHHHAWDVRGGDGVDIDEPSCGFSSYQEGSWLDVSNRALYAAWENDGT